MHPFCIRFGISATPGDDLRQRCRLVGAVSPGRIGSRVVFTAGIIFNTTMAVAPDTNIAPATGASAIVTHNIRHFRGVDELGLRVLTPRQLLQELPQ